MPILPDDILTRIFKTLLNQPQDHLSSSGFFEKQHSIRQGPQPNRSLLATTIPLVCRRWRLLSQALLYSEVEIYDGYRFPSFLETVRHRPDLGRITATLIVVPLLYDHKKDMIAEIKAGERTESWPKEEDIDYGDDDDSECGEAHEYITSEALLFELLPLLPNLKHLCLSSGRNHMLKKRHISLFPTKLELLCLHDFELPVKLLSSLPQALTRLSLEGCYPTDWLQPLDLSNLRYLQWTATSKKNDWPPNAFMGCCALKSLRVDLGFSSSDTDLFNEALEAILSHLNSLEIVIGARKIPLSKWFKSRLSFLHHLTVNGHISSADVVCLPSLLRTFTWRSAGIGDAKAVNAFCTFLKKASSLPRLAAIPDIELDSNAQTLVNIDDKLVRETYEHLKSKRGLVEGTSSKGKYYLWH